MNRIAFGLICFFSIALLVFSTVGEQMCEQPATWTIGNAASVTLFLSIIIIAGFVAGYVCGQEDR
jgi:hypothetical protein